MSTTTEIIVHIKTKHDKAFGGDVAANRKGKQSQVRSTPVRNAMLTDKQMSYRKKINIGQARKHNH
jgi:hypothetical protein